MQSSWWDRWQFQIPASHFSTSTVAFHVVKEEQIAFLLSSSSLLSSLTNPVARCYGLSLLDSDMQTCTPHTDSLLHCLSVVLINKAKQFFCLIIIIRASLVAQWLRICLPMQGTRVRALVQEDPTCHGATKPMHHNYWARALEPVSHNCWSLRA